MPHRRAIILIHLRPWGQQPAPAILRVKRKTSRTLLVIGRRRWGGLRPQRTTAQQTGLGQCCSCRGRQTAGRTAPWTRPAVARGIEAEAVQTGDQRWVLDRVHLAKLYMQRTDRISEVGTYDDIKSVKHIFGNPLWGVFISLCTNMVLYCTFCLYR